MTRRDDWLAERRSYVTASDVAALLGESAYKTRGQLRMEKMGLADEWTGSEHTDIALALEPAILGIASQRWGWELRHNVDSELHEDAHCARLAATPDAWMSTPWGMAIVQVKLTQCAATEDCEPFTKRGKPSAAKWLNGPPIDYQLQVQAELACTDYYHGVLLALHHGSGMKMRAYYVPRHEAVIARIRRETMAFWEEIENETGV